MLRIVTNIKNVSFGSYKDLLLYMRDEKLDMISYEVYLFHWDKTPLFQMSLHTLKEVENIVNNEGFEESFSVDHSRDDDYDLELEDDEEEEIDYDD